MPETTYILSGSNLGDREKNLTKAIDKIEYIPGIEIIAISAIYESPAVGMEGENPDFLNQAIMLDYQYLPLELLGELEKIEVAMGRENKSDLKPRLIDLDILLFGDEIINDERLIVPHKELLNREFAMKPLLQLTPDIIHPKTKKPISSYLNKFEESQVKIYKDQVARNI
jgi:2-amino-4-hydroxy-6-hydroxymethyldihydropteridine diphosphokinase